MKIIFLACKCRQSWLIHTINVYLKLPCQQVFGIVSVLCSAFSQISLFTRRNCSFVYIIKSHLPVHGPHTNCINKQINGIDWGASHLNGLKGTVVLFVDGLADRCNTSEFWISTVWYPFKILKINKWKGLFLLWLQTLKNYRVCGLEVLVCAHLAPSWLQS